MRFILLAACVLLFSVVMLGVRYAAHGVFDNFGYVGLAITLTAILGAAYWHDHRTVR